MADDGLAGAGFERMLQNAEQGMSNVTELRERITEIVGRAEAAAGRITAEYTSEGGMSALELDPRVLRLPSAQLSQEIRAAVNAAAKDFQRQLSQVGGQVFGMTGAAALDPDDPAAAKRFQDPAVAMAQVDKLGNAFAGQMKDLLRELSMQQRRAQEAAERYRDLGPRS